MTAETTIKHCKEIFTDYGIPKVMVSDNGRNFRSTMFTQFLNSQGVVSKFTAPYHPATNELAERLVQSLKISLKKIRMNTPKPTLEDALQEFLTQYRSAPHCKTGVTPYERMFNRKMRTKLTVDRSDLQRKVTNFNMHKKARNFTLGERVTCRNYNGVIKWKFGRVIQRLGKIHYKIKSEDGRCWEQHVDQMRKTGNQRNYNVEPFTGNYDTEPNAEPNGDRDPAVEEPQREPHLQEEIVAEPVLRKSTRISRPPQRFPK